jgi:hypothetical protein
MRQGNNYCLPEYVHSSPACNSFSATVIKISKKYHLSEIIYPELKNAISDLKSWGLLK